MPHGCLDASDTALAGGSQDYTTLRHASNPQEGRAVYTAYTNAREEERLCPLLLSDHRSLVLTREKKRCCAAVSFGDDPELLAC